MSKKHFDEYFLSVVKTYKDMLDTLHDLEEECNNKLIDPDKVEQMKALIEPIKQNYMTMSWVMFLLNKPNRKSKHKNYNRQLFNKMLQLDPDKKYSLDNINNSNKQILDELKKVFD